LPPTPGTFDGQAPPSIHIKSKKGKTLVVMIEEEEEIYIDRG
jgi:hypothetical protein